MQFNVPQFLDIEDKIIGPLTLKQFGIVLAGGFILYLLYRFLPFGIFIIAGLPVAIFAAALAFIKINGRPFIKIVSAFISYLFKPKLYIWKRKKTQ